MFNMKKRIILPLILILYFISACHPKEINLEDEDVRLYEKEFLDQSENWEVKLHLKEIDETWSPENELPYEADILTIKYLKEIEEDLKFHYKMNYSDPVAMITEPGYKITLQNQKMYTETHFQQKMIEEVCFGTLMLEVHWEDSEGELQEENFIFNDNQNPACERIVPLAPRG